jgi:hypothetical protein
MAVALLRCTTPTLLLRESAQAAAAATVGRAMFSEQVYVLQAGSNITIFLDAQVHSSQRALRMHVNIERGLLLYRYSWIL